MGARLRTGDKVIVISGKEKGKTGEVKQILADADRVVVAGVNIVKRHVRPNPRMPQGGIVEKEAPLHVSNVQPVDPKTGKGTRVSFKTDDKGVKSRVAKSGETIPSPTTASKAS